MRIKVLDYLIVAVLAAVLSVGIAFLIRSVTTSVHPIGLLSLELIESIAHVMVFYNLFVFIKGLFGKQQVWMALMSAVLIALLIPVFYGSLFLVFEGEFNLNYPVNTLLMSFPSNLLTLVRLIVTYFTETLFETADVVGGMMAFVLTLFVRFVQWIVIPISPLLFALRDVFRGDEEYRFVKAEVEITHDNTV